MPEFKLNGKTYSGSTSYASAIDYTEADGSKTTVQDKISEMDSNIDELNKKTTITTKTLLLSVTDNALESSYSIDCIKYKKICIDVMCPNTWGLRRIINVDDLLVTGEWNDYISNMGAYVSGYEVGVTFQLSASNIGFKYVFKGTAVTNQTVTINVSGII